MWEYDRVIFPPFIIMTDSHLVGIWLVGMCWVTMMMILMIWIMMKIDDDLIIINFHHDSDHEYHNMMTLRTVTMIRPQELGDCWEHPELYARLTFPRACSSGNFAWWHRWWWQRWWHRWWWWWASPSCPLLGLCNALCAWYAVWLICTEIPPVSSSAFVSISTLINCKHQYHCYLCYRQDWKSTRGWGH